MSGHELPWWLSSRDLPGLNRSHGEGNGNPFQYSCLENPMDRGTWQATVYCVAKSWTQLRGQAAAASRHRVQRIWTKMELWTRWSKWKPSPEELGIKAETGFDQWWQGGKGRFWREGEPEWFWRGGACPRAELEWTGSSNDYQQSSGSRRQL